MNGYKNDSGPANILVIRLSALGDVVRTLPAVLSISDAFPGSRITWVTETLGASFLNSHPRIDNVLILPTRVWRKVFLTRKGFVDVARQLFAFLRNLRSVRYDIVVDFHGVLKSAVVCLLARSERKVGYDRSGAGELSYLAYSEIIHLPEGKISRYTRNMKLAEHLGGKPSQREDLIHVPPHIESELSSFFDKLPPGNPVFAVHPGTSARAPYKRWFAERYAALCDEIVTRLNGTVLLTWAPDEHEFVRRITERAKETVHEAPETKTPLHLAYLLSRSDMYIGSDTGAMHIATLAGTPVAAIWGPTDPVENEPGPYSPHEIALGGADCAPCRKMGCLQRKCMAAIEVEDVLSAVERLLERIGVRTGSFSAPAPSPSGRGSG